MAGYASTPTIQEAEAWGRLWVQSLPMLDSEIYNIWDDTVRIWLKKKKKKPTKQRNQPTI